MDNYEFITSKINELKRKYPSLRMHTDDYVFSVLCFKNHFYKDLAQTLDENDFAEIVVDGSRDGGADILLNDPHSESSDLVIGQSKFHKTISAEAITNALSKMAQFYKDMTEGHYERFNSRVQSQFLRLNAERGDDSKIHFVFYTSASYKKSIDPARIERNFRNLFDNSNAIDVSILFVDDIAGEIRSTEVKDHLIQEGKLRIDRTGNVLRYGDDAAIVNVSAFSIKKLYAKHDKTLLARNLRYHIKGKNEKKVDEDISKTIEKSPTSFWLKNNGITIICDSFRIDGREVHLRNFSIVNGGQTTYMLHKNENLVDKNDFYLPCKIIKTVGDDDKQRDKFILEVAEAANLQKAIKPADLKANTREQRRFAKAMEAVGVFYQTKRGEEIPKKCRLVYLHTNLLEVGKLCLAAIFQEPCKSRNNPSIAYKDDDYYNPIFRGNQAQVAQICKELLYIDNYFTKIFLPKFEQDNKKAPDAEHRIPFARISRRICVAFVALAARYHYGNITDENITALISTSTPANEVREMFKSLGDMKTLLPMKLHTDAYDAALDKLFATIIKNGVRNYKVALRHNSNVTATNFFKADRNYYDILSDNWDTIEEEIQQTFSEA